jgi:hypothetical protein
MYGAYSDCSNLTGSPVCGDNVTNMAYAYYNCQNLTGSPVCGANVNTMNYTYYNCKNLTGVAIVGPNVTSMGYTYSEVKGLTDIYIYSNKLSTMYKCVGNKDNSLRMNIYVPKTGPNSSNNTIARCLYNNTSSIVGSTITWTNDMTTNGCHYNTTYNIYIYPVDNVQNAYNENELK